MSLREKPSRWLFSASYIIKLDLTVVMTTGSTVVVVDVTITAAVVVVPGSLTGPTVVVVVSSGIATGAVVVVSYSGATVVLRCRPQACTLLQASRESSRGSRDISRFREGAEAVVLVVL